jgi:hypothetical protein
VIAQLFHRKGGSSGTAFTNASGDSHRDTQGQAGRRHQCVPSGRVHSTIADGIDGRSGANAIKQIL